jgi:molybdate transport system ATP-binding protein
VKTIHHAVADRLKEQKYTPFITFDNVTLRVRDRRILANTCWAIKEGQNWAVLGPNGSGKSTLMRALTGETPVVKGNIQRHHPLATPASMGYVSFETHRQLIAREQAADAARYFSGDIESYLTPQGLMETVQRNDGQPAGNAKAAVVFLLGIERLLDRPVRFLSTGEIRRILIAWAVLRSKGMLLLDEPFEGLDSAGRKHLGASIDHLITSGVRVMLATHRMENLLPAFTHVIGLKAGRIFCSGPRDQVLTPESLERLYDLTFDARDTIGVTSALDPLRDGGRPKASSAEVTPKPDNPVLIEMKNVGVYYQG